MKFSIEKLYFEGSADEWRELVRSIPGLSTDVSDAPTSEAPAPATKRTYSTSPEAVYKREKRAQAKLGHASDICPPMSGHGADMSVDVQAENSKTSENSSDIAPDTADICPDMSGVGGGGVLISSSSSPSEVLPSLPLFQPSSGSNLSGQDRARGTRTDVERVFAWWVSERAKVLRSSGPPPKLDAKRTKLIELRLRDGYTAGNLMRAISGACATPHNRGENERRTVYLDLGLILRDSDHIDRFMLAAPARPPRPAPPPQAPEPEAEVAPMREAALAALKRMGLAVGGDPPAAAGAT